MGAEHAEYVVVLVHGLAEVPALLLVPPFSVRVAELSLDGRGVDETAVHVRVFGVGESRMVWKFLIKNFPVAERLG